MTPETPLAQRVRAALDAAPTSATARRLLEIDAVDIARAYLGASAEIERLTRIEAAARALVEAVDASGCQRGHSIRVLAEALGMGEPLSAP